MKKKQGVGCIFGLFLVFFLIPFFVAGCIIDFVKWIFEIMKKGIMDVI